MSHVAAIKFLKLFAQWKGLPVAVNVSLGMNAGAHDGQSTLETHFDALSTKGTEGGFAIVKSAGNEHNRAGHARVYAAEGVAEKVTWDSSSGLRWEDYFEAWFSGEDELAFELADPAGRRIGPVTRQAAVASAMHGGNQIEMKLTSNHPDNGDNLLTILVRPGANAIQPGLWVLSVIGERVITDGRVDLWVERRNSRPVKFVQNVNEEMTLSIPGTANTVISVASCGLATPVRLADSSSRGPTRTMGPKPDLTAAGDDVEGALAGSLDHRANTVSSGTSFSAPLVTGAIVLAFSRREKQRDQDPTLDRINANQVRTALIRSASPSRPRHHAGLGRGCLNAAQFVSEF